MSKRGLTILEVSPDEQDPETALFSNFVALVETIKAGASVQIHVVYPPVPQKREQPRLFMKERGVKSA